MDKPTYTSAYVPPRSAYDVQAAQRSAAVNPGSASNGQSASFEAALERIRDRVDASDADADAAVDRELFRKADEAQAQSAVTAQPSDSESMYAASQIDEYDEQAEVPGFSGSDMCDVQSLSDDVLDESGQAAIDAANSLQAARPLDIVDVVVLQSAQVSSSVDGAGEKNRVSSSQMEAGLSAIASMDIHAVGTAEATASTASNLHGTQSAESVSLLMAQLDRASISSDGHWQFSVLNDQAGVNALVLQRSSQGSWQVSVSLEESSMIDSKRQADELMAALQGKGHSVESVTFDQGSVSQVSTFVDD